jgi:hypothetical protein
MHGPLNVKLLAEWEVTESAAFTEGLFEIRPEELELILFSDSS